MIIYKSLMFKTDLFFYHAILDSMNQRPVSAATVFPKVNMNQPILRRPNPGEVGLSMNGSPLLVSSFFRNDMATVNVPLANGNVNKI